MCFMKMYKQDHRCSILHFGCLTCPVEAYQVASSATIGSCIRCVNTSVAVSGVTFRNNTLHGVPPQSFLSESTLQVIDLSFNHLSSISASDISALTPAALANVSTRANLRLFFNNNNISSLGDELFAEFDASVHAELSVNLDSNAIESIKASVFDSCTHSLSITLSDNFITSLGENLLAGFGGLRLRIGVDGNKLESLNPSMFSSIRHTTTQAIIVSCENNFISSLNSSLLSGFQLPTLVLDLGFNQITAIDDATFVNRDLEVLVLFLNDNRLQSVGDLLSGDTLRVNISAANNNVSSFTFPTAPQGYVAISLDGNMHLDSFTVSTNWRVPVYTSLLVSIRNAGLEATQYFPLALTNELLNTIQITRDVSLDLHNNSIEHSGLTFILGHLKAPTVLLDVSSNNVTSLVSDVFGSALGTHTTILLGNNTFVSVSRGAFNSIQVATLLLDFTSCSGLSKSFGLEGVENFAFYQSTTLTTLSLNLGSTYIDLCTVVSVMGQLLSPTAMTGPQVMMINVSSNGLTNASRDNDTSVCAHIVASSPWTLQLDLSHNLLTAIPTDLLPLEGTMDLSYNRITSMQANVLPSRTAASALDLSNNAITFIDANAMHYNTHLLTLGLSFNQLTYIPVGFVENAAFLLNFNVSNNALVALPLASNRIAHPDDALYSVLLCAQYVPTLVNCTCPSHMVYTEFCGYGRCTTTLSGCPPQERASVIAGTDSPDCSLAPFSVCEPVAPNCNGTDSYQAMPRTNTTNPVCLPLTVCATAFPIDHSNGSYHPAYQFQPATPTQDRVCTICSVCPSYYHTTQCTATSNAQCDKGLSPELLSAIGLAVAIVLVFAYWLHYRTNRPYTFSKEINALEDLLQETALVSFSDLVPPKEIAVTQLLIYERDVVGQGEFGRVLSGRYKQRQRAMVEAPPIDVVVKQAKGSTGRESLRWEAVALNQFHHPHIVKLLGVVTSRQQTMLVIEFCHHLSVEHCIDHLVRNEHLDASQKLAFSTMAQIALDVASGMEYLHARNYVHGDLAARNILVTRSYVYKISDFGLTKATERADPAAHTQPSRADKASGSSWWRCCSVRGSLATTRGGGVASAAEMADQEDKGDERRFPWNWYPPEILEAHHRLNSCCVADIIAHADDAYTTEPTKPSDVWGFGMLLLELFSNGRPPYYAFVDNYRRIHGNTDGVFQCVLPHLKAACNEIATIDTSAPLPGGNDEPPSPQEYAHATRLTTALQPFSVQERGWYSEVRFFEHILAKCCAYAPTERIGFATVASELARLHSYLGFCDGIPRCTRFSTCCMQGGNSAVIDRTLPLRVPNDGYESPAWVGGGGAVGVHEVPNPLFPPPAHGADVTPDHAAITLTKAQRRLEGPSTPTPHTPQRSTPSMGWGMHVRDPVGNHSPALPAAPTDDDEFLQPDRVPSAVWGVPGTGV
eukprot:m.1310866 g.1310866  ORF g.1310866 m.1310866 type:complete len:1422 (-) comp24828_c0_seq3:474-4739(-)